MAFSHAPARRRHVLLACLVLASLNSCQGGSESAASLDAGDAATRDSAACEAARTALKEPIDGCETLHVDVYVRERTNRFPLPVDGVSFLLPKCDQPFPCQASSPSSYRCEVPGTAAGLAVRDLGLAAELGDDRHSKVVSLIEAPYPPDRGLYCEASAYLPLPLDSCVDGIVPALQGSVLGVAEGTELRVGLLKPYTYDDDLLWIRGEERDCTVDGTSYRCPSHGTEDQYVLWVRSGQQTLAVRRTRAEVADCEVRTFHYDVRPSTCDVEVWFGPDVNALDRAAPSVTMNLPGETVTCERANAEEAVFRCPLPASSYPGAAMVKIETSVATLELRPPWVPSAKCEGAKAPMGLLLMPSTTVGFPAIFLSAQQLQQLGVTSEAD